MTLPELVIDLREEHELLEKKLVSNGNSNRYEIVNIPSRHIFANVDWIKKQTEKRPVWLICASGRRSQAIKDQYFATNDGIKSSVGGLTFGFDKQVGESVDAEHISIQTGEGGLGMQQYMQVAFAMMLLVSALLVYFKMSRSTTLAVIGALNIHQKLSSW
jgi:rhodanese-related sulfurtransferase